MKPYRPLEVDVIRLFREDVLTASGGEMFDPIDIDQIGEGVIFTWKQ